MNKISSNSKIRPANRRAWFSMLALALTLGVSGCAQTLEWENWDKPKKEWAGDRAECRASAEKLINKEQAHSSVFNPQERGALEQQFTLFDARKQRDEFYKECLRDKGYKPVKAQARAE
ncbi:MAG: hypothetical protein HQ503_09855 [Rhodospirillales bacterium]|nr:hypothetical protein [Rhodospirillales bacterium]